MELLTQDGGKSIELAVGIRLVNVHTRQAGEITLIEGDSVHIGGRAWPFHMIESNWRVSDTDKFWHEKRALG